MPPFDGEIDRLYQLAPGAFTGARNALAKQAGKPAGDAIRTLVKPQLAAWAVNQVYWRDRVAFDRLVKAAEAVRGAHRRLVSGEEADLAAAEAAHAEALGRAVAVARAALAESGEAVSPAVSAAVSDTLRALPTADPFGRLAKPLTPASGFEAFAGVVARGPGTAHPATAPAPLRLQKGAATEDAARAKQRTRERARLDAELAEATAASKAAEKALEDLQKALARAERERDRRQAALDEAAAAVRDLAARLPEAKRAREAADHERERLERKREARDE